MRTDQEILDQLEELGEQDSNDREIDELRDIVHELLDDRRFWSDEHRAMLAEREERREAQREQPL